ncbi:MAG: sigma-54-dependent Fis family transcriptional regulator [Fibrobacteres bacterium]|nr:sigma-54-dependent Fis family transcriptional regulator [Fibrobacterota bacterium]
MNNISEKITSYSLESIVGWKGAMSEVYESIKCIVDTDTTVIIRGESGTGKELAANIIHYNSQRAKKPFVKVNIAALPESLIDSELFGYEKGAFTGAVQSKPGRFELASGGTIFLDEIGDMPLSTQVKLLRVLQEREIERLGSVKTTKVDVRILAATHKNLEDMVKLGTFRSDLYYRLNVYPVFLPPLRERKTDIIPLAEHFIAEFCKQHNKTVKRISTPALDMMMSYEWHGNIRELQNCIERAVLMSSDGVIHGYHLSPALQTADFSGTRENRTLKEAVDAFEKELIIETLKSTSGNRSKAAKTLGTTERILGYKCSYHKIDYKHFRSHVKVTKT